LPSRVIGNLEYAALRTFTTTREHFQSRRQFLQREGLGHVIVGTGFKASELLFKCIACGQHQHGRLFVGFMAQFTRHVQAIHTRQREIKHDHVEIVDHGQMQARDAISGEIHHMATIFQIVADIGRNIAVVFNHQNAHASLRYACRRGAGGGTSLTTASSKC
jgi:hypothetical protein